MPPNHVLSLNDLDVLCLTVFGLKVLQERYQVVALPLTSTLQPVSQEYAFASRRIHFVQMLPVSVGREKMNRISKWYPKAIEMFSKPSVPRTQTIVSDVSVVVHAIALYGKSPELYR